METNCQTEITEEWRAIPTYEGLYEVSNIGRIKSLSGPKSPRILKYSNNRGYLTVELWKERKNFRFTVHKLVCLCFLGPRPDGLQINHKNGVKGDNSVGNLEYCTPSENKLHAFRLGLQSNKGENHSQNKLTDESVRTIRNMILEGISQKAIAEHFSVNQSTISFIKTGKLWAHLK